jgi:hypothetical protein
MRRALLTGIVVALAGVLLVGLAEGTSSSGEPINHGTCTAQQTRAWIVSTLQTFRAAGWKLTPRSQSFLKNRDLQSLTSAEGSAGLVQLAAGEGRSVPSMGATPKRSRRPASASGHQTAYYNPPCFFGAPAYLMHWSGATSSTYVNFTEQDYFGSLSIHQTNHLSCSVVNAPCLYLASDDPPSSRQVISGTPFSYYASHSIYSYWCGN